MITAAVTEFIVEFVVLDAADNKSSDDASHVLWRKKGENKQTNSSMVKETFLKFSVAALLQRSEQRGEREGEMAPIL